MNTTTDVASVIKPTRMWKKFSYGALALCAIAIPIKFYEDSFNQRSTDCSFFGGTPTERSLFTATKACTWPKQKWNRPVNMFGYEERGLEVVVRFCKSNKGTLDVRNLTENAVCVWQ